MLFGDSIPAMAKIRPCPFPWVLAVIFTLPGDFTRAAAAWAFHFLDL